MNILNGGTTRACPLEEAIRSLMTEYRRDARADSPLPGDCYVHWILDRNIMIMPRRIGEGSAFTHPRGSRTQEYTGRVLWCTEAVRPRAPVKSAWDCPGTCRQGRRMRRPCPFPGVDRCKRLSASKIATVDDEDRCSRARVARCGVTVVSRCRIHQEETGITGSRKSGWVFWC